jgi:hypothetical protein
MVMSIRTFEQRQFDGRSKLRLLPLFKATSDTFNPPGRLPKPL